MIELTVVVLLLALVMGALLAWRVRVDRAADAALATRAEIQSAVNRALQGESLLAVQVEAPSVTHTGRVVVTTPTGYEWLVRDAWAPIVQRVPEGYELVLKHPA